MLISTATYPYLTPLENETHDEFMQRIINARHKERDKENYQEEHHMMPKCKGGENDKSNLVFLYAEEHYYAHKLLALEHPEHEGLQNAWRNMCQCTRDGRTYIVDAEEFAEARRRSAAANSARMTEYYTTHNGPNLGVTFTEEHCEKISKALTGITRSEETRRLTSLHHADVSGDKNPRAKTVKCLETGDVFTTIAAAMKWANINNHNAIPNNANGKQSYAGKHPITGEKLHWVFIE